MVDIGKEKKYQNILLARDFVIEKGSTKIPIQSIRKMSVEFGFLSKHPLIQLILGMIVSALGLLPIFHFFLVFQYGGKFKFIEALAVAFFVVGIYLVISCLRKGYFLSLETEFGNKRLVFGNKVRKDEVVDFIKTARNFGYSIFSELG
jgi:hypothetical protein